MTAALPVSTASAINRTDCGGRTDFVKVWYDGGSRTVRYADACVLAPNLPGAEGISSGNHNVEMWLGNEVRTMGRWPIVIDVENLDPTLHLLQIRRPRRSANSAGPLTPQVRRPRRSAGPVAPPVRWVRGEGPCSGPRPPEHGPSARAGAAAVGRSRRGTGTPGRGTGRGAARGPRTVSTSAVVVPTSFI
ncbi:hypothetical protein SAMN05216505_104182 [Streptomyces prasinopilosus]|uniref:Uncharacterized protein n=2 Tax=Streptomyces prasinopilosus TaxID=67344 RepID=A0A1G6QMD4_9ACTN|nr:hypothetical protein SAMN05216505_104182 [Streptomyces prasinopilosus]